MAKTLIGKKSASRELDLSAEIAQFQKYILSDIQEDSKGHDIYPLFKKIFKDKFKIESAASMADVYAEGQILVECKKASSQWLDGFYQALHYKRKFGLAYNTIMVIAHKFVGIWKLDKLPETAVIFANTIDVNLAPNKVGKENSKRTIPALKNEIMKAAFYWLTPSDFEKDAFSGGKSITFEGYEIVKILRKLDSDRLLVNTHNFINTIARMEPFFDSKIEAVHAFYTIVNYWDITSKMSVNEAGDKAIVTGYNGARNSDPIKIAPRHVFEFKRFVESQYIFTNEGSGLTADYYFSRFDEVMAAIDPEYVKQHGIFFTDSNLSRFALWFAKHHFPGNINEDFIWFDPAGGSGNLISSWRGKMKHKIISELQPDLLKIIERRMKADPFAIESGFTIVPKTSDGVGLNFLDCTAKEYLDRIEKEIGSNNIKLDKPFAFLLNPPYKNTDENQDVRDEKEAGYGIDDSIIALTGEDAGKERYLAFLGQILNLSREQAKKGLKPIVLIFTPTSWLIPRPTYVPFRKVWDRHFRYHNGFIVTSNEFFKLDGKWPVAFTIWNYDDKSPLGDLGVENTVKVFDLTPLKHADLNNINWVNADEETLEFQLDGILADKKMVTLDNSRGYLRNELPLLERKGQNVAQTRLNIYRNITNDEKGKEIISGFPLKDDRHRRIKAPYGYSDGGFIGFMDDTTPVRIKQEPANRLSNLPDRIWFYLDNRILQVNLLKCFNGTPDKYGYCAYDLPSAQIICTWFGIGKSIVGKYPLWANMYDIWPPNIKEDQAHYWYSLCFAFVLAENRCVVTKFEKDNPVAGAPEVFVDNPLSPLNPKSFWNTTLLPFVYEQSDLTLVRGGGRNDSTNQNAAIMLINRITDFYKYWNKEYCKGQILQNVGLQNEPYFRYFDYADFLTKDSGIIQIKKYAELHGKTDLQTHFADIAEATKRVKAELYRLLTVEFGYFE